MSPTHDLDTERLIRPERKMSQFVAQEMLYEYLRGDLDHDRQVAVEQSLKKYPDLLVELNAMKAAEEYLQKLSQTKISPAHMNELEKIKRATEVLRDKAHWRSWPEPVRWAGEALVVSFVVAVVALLFPWAKLTSNISDFKSEVVLNEAPRGMVPQIPAIPPVAPATPAPTTPPLEDEGITEPVVRPRAAGDKKIATGLLYRLKMGVADADQISAQIRESIINAGGVKAGEVDLGWRKTGPDGNYFHFTLPETKYQELLTTLGAYGPVRIYKQQHERLMPDGQIRIILWVEDNNLGNEAK